MALYSARALHICVYPDQGEQSTHHFLEQSGKGARIPSEKYAPPHPILIMRREIKFTADSFGDSEPGLVINESFFSNHQFFFLKVDIITFSNL
jgi:hypothetical protein